MVKKDKKGQSKDQASEGGDGSDDARVDAAVQLLMTAEIIDDRVMELVNELLAGRPPAVREHVYSIARQTRDINPPAGEKRRRPHH